MNLLILSVGRRCEIVDYFKQEFDRVLAVDITEYAPALYHADSYFILKKDLETPLDYMEEILKICEREKVTAILTLIDPELLLLDQYRQRFLDIGTIPILSEAKVIRNTYDKYSFYCDNREILNLVATYASPEEVLQKHSFDNNSPLLIKPICGSGSIGINTIHYANEFKTLKFNRKYHYIYQPFIFGKEYGIDLYFDMNTKQIVSVFMKEKISLRAGETDKAVSVLSEDIWQEIKKLESCGKFSGPVDVDVFVKNDGTVYLNEVNPRIGGGYPMAHACGINFMKLAAGNLRGETHTPQIGGYPEGVKMMKYSQVLSLNGKES